MALGKKLNAILTMKFHSIFDIIVSILFSKLIKWKPFGNRISFKRSQCALKKKDKRIEKLAVNFTIPQYFDFQTEEKPNKV